MEKKYYDTFYGNKVSEYGLEHGYVDYHCLAKSFDAVLNNHIIDATQTTGYWNEYNGSEYDEETDSYADIYQFYIISEQGARILAEYTDEIVWYSDTFDMYVWGVTHWGTSWNYVLTNIPLEEKEA